MSVITLKEVAARLYSSPVETGVIRQINDIFLSNVKKLTETNTLFTGKVARYKGNG